MGQDIQARDARAIEVAKSTNADRLDPSLPEKAFASWLQDLTVVHTDIHWEVNDCGEQTGDPALDKGRDFPMCVQAEMALPEKSKLYVQLAVGTFKKGIHSGPPSFFSAYFVEPDGAIHSIRKLSQIPEAVQAIRAQPPAEIERGPDPP